MINSDETHLKKNSHILHELTEGFGNNNENITQTINKNFKKLSLKYHPDKNLTNSDQAEEKFKALNAFNAKITDANNTAETIANLKRQYPISSPDFTSSSAFRAERKPVAPKQTKDKPIDPIKPEDKKFFESFKRNYLQKSFAIQHTLKFNDQGLEKCFVSFRNREYKRFVKSTNNSSGATEFRHTSTFDKATYENYIFFPDQTNPETLSHDQIILESYKQAVTENKIAKPDDLSHPEKPSQDKAGDEYNFLKFKDDFIKSYTNTNANIKTGRNTNTSYLTDRLIDRIEEFTGKKTKNDIEPKAPEKLAPIKNEPPTDYEARLLKYNANLETYKISYAEYNALNSIFDELCKNDNVKTFLEKEKTKYLQEKEAEERKLEEAKEAEERKLKERENSIEGRWSSLVKSLLKLQEDASSQLAGVSSSLADVSSEIGSSINSTSSAVHGFSSNLAESAKKEVGSLAMTISTSATTTFTQVSSTAMSWIVSIKLPQINLPSVLPVDQASPHEPEKQEPETTHAKETLGQRIMVEELKRREQEERVKKAIETAKTASLRAQEEAAQKAAPTPMRRANSAPAPSIRTQAKPANPNPPPKRTNSAPLQKPEPRQDNSRIAFFGKAAKNHSANNPNRGRKPNANGPKKSSALNLGNPPTPPKPRTK